MPHNRVGGADRTAEEVFAQEKRWPEEMRALRSILRDTPLTEEGKWGHPCCTFEGSCVVTLGGFKDNFVVSFLKGALLTDPQGVLQGPGENSHSARMIRFPGLAQIAPMWPRRLRRNRPG